MPLTLGRTRVIVHPLALLYPLAAAMLGTGVEAGALVIALTCHEAAHLLAARSLGVEIASLRLTPFGGAMRIENPYGLSPLRLALVAAAGPLANALLVTAAGALAHWRLLSPGAALAAIQANLALMAFNLLPALPLDGGRIAYALMSMKLRPARALDAGVWMGRAVAALLLAACAALAVKYRRVNLSFLFAAVFIWASAADERQALSDAPMKAVLGTLRPVEGVVPARLCAVSADCAIHAALRAARPGVTTLYAVYKDDRLSSITDDRRLVEAALKRGTGVSVGEAARA